MSSSGGSSQPRDWTHISYDSCIGRQVLYHYCHLALFKAGDLNRGPCAELKEVYELPKVLSKILQKLLFFMRKDMPGRILLRKIQSNFILHQHLSFIKFSKLRLRWVKACAHCHSNCFLDLPRDPRCLNGALVSSEAHISFAEHLLFVIVLISSNCYSKVPHAESLKPIEIRTSLVQWLRIYLATQRTQVWSLPGELDSHVHITEPTAITTELVPHNSRVCVPQWQMPRDAVKIPRAATRTRGS